AMSGGRVELGLGAGWYEAEHTAYGMPFPPLGERFERLEEQLAIVTGLWSTPVGDRFGFTGRHYQVSDRPALPKPVQRPGPPSIIGGGGPARTPRVGRGRERRTGRGQRARGGRAARARPVRHPRRGALQAGGLHGVGGGADLPADPGRGRPGPSGADRRGGPAPLRGALTRSDPPGHVARRGVGPSFSRVTSGPPMEQTRPP